MEALNLSEQFVIEDLEEYVPRLLPKQSRKNLIGQNDLFKQQDFFRYLVSVASHPIGLRTSVKPFNCKEEEMLNYLVDVFDIQDFDRLKKILASYRDSDAAKDRVDPAKLTQIIKSRRRHSWRPELRIRIKPPAFYYRERHYIDNLSVRVYLFKEDDSIKTEVPVVPTSSDTNQDSKNQYAVLNNIFRTSKIDASRRIRPINELRSLVKFERISSSSEDPAGNQTGYKMVKIINGQKIDGDIHLKIRRIYCEPGSNFILRFEFWLNSEAVEVKWYDQSRRYLKRLVFDGPSACISRGKSVYDNEDKDFYGYVNYNLSQLPSHAIKLDRPIVTLHNRKMNNCEICIEARNRRLETDDNNVSVPKRRADKSQLVSNQDFIVSHIRLYANCFLYQSLKLIETRGESLIESYMMENVTIDRLLYMSAQTLINQHRLQSNFNKYEDESLRRIAAMLLANSLQSKFGGYKRDANIVLNLLISLAKNEYALSRKVIDERTMQELDPFFDYPPSRTTNLIAEMEMSTIRRFALSTLKERVKKYFLPRHPKDDFNRTITLISLSMFKRALNHQERLSSTYVDIKNLRYDIGELSDYMTKILTGLAEKFMTIRFNYLIERPSTSDDRGIEPENSTKSGFIDNDSWPRLLRDIRSLTNDIVLYWSSKGIDSLEAREERVAKEIGFSKRRNLSKLIKLKIDDFLD